MKSATIIYYKGLSALNHFMSGFRRRNPGRIIFSLLGLLFLVFIYFLTYRFINYIRGVSLLGPVLVAKFFEMIFMVFFSMLVFSSIITGFNSIFSSRDMNYLIHLPVDKRDILTVKYLETAFHSSWMVLLIFMPVFLATGETYKAGLLFYLISFVCFAFFISLSTALGFGIAIMLIRWFPTRKIRDLFLVLGLILAAAIFVFIRLIQPERLINPSETIGIFEYLASLSSPAGRFWPHYWISKCVLLSAVGLYLKSMAWTVLMISFSAAALLLLYLFFRDRFVDIYRNIRTYQGIYISDILPSGQITALFLKDIKSFMRDTSQWSQLFILVALIVIYIFNIYKLPLDSIHLKHMVALMNIAMAGFVVASVCLRFVFTAVSLEGKAYWIIRSSLLSYRTYIIEKLILNGVPVIIVAFPVVVVSNIVLKIHGAVFLWSVITIALLTLTLMCMAMGFGMMYPKFDYDNPVQIESSYGGFLYMIYSFFLILLTVSIEAWPMRMYFFQQLGNKNALNIPVSILAFVVLTIVYILAAAYTLKKGILNMENCNI